MLPIPNVILMCVSVLGVHVKVVSSCSTYETPAFNLPTLRAAQGNALDWQVPVYPGIRYVLLVKVWTLLLVKLQTRVLPNVRNVENVWSMGQYYVKKCGNSSFAHLENQLRDLDGDIVLDAD